MYKDSIFSRGRGYGHAIPDMAIVAELLKRYDTEIQFVSYSTGAEAFRTAGFDVVDLGMPENNPYIQTLSACGKAIHSYRPDVVVSHEEFAALPAASMSDVPSIFVSAWLPATGSIFAESLAYASAIIVLGEPGLFPVPPEAHVRPSYAGHMKRMLTRTPADRDTLRDAWKIPRHAVLIAVVPGGASTEKSHPISGVALSAFQSLDAPEKYLVWVSEKDWREMDARARDVPNMRAVRFAHPIEDLLAQSDIILTKGTRGITLDAATLGIPSISLSNGTNRIDDLVVPRIPNNTALISSATDGDALLFHLRRSLARIHCPADYLVPPSHAAELLAAAMHQAVRGAEAIC